MSSDVSWNAEHRDLRSPKVSAEGRIKSEFGRLKYHLMWIENKLVKMSEKALCRKTRCSVSNHK